MALSVLNQTVLAPKDIQILNSSQDLVNVKIAQVEEMIDS